VPQCVAVSRTARGPGQVILILAGTLLPFVSAVAPPGPLPRRGYDRAGFWLWNLSSTTRCLLSLRSSYTMPGMAPRIARLASPSARPGRNVRGLGINRFSRLQTATRAT
jgi:hypothetical protein